MTLESALKDLRTLADSRGYKIEEAGQTIIIKHASAPLVVEVTIRDDSARVELKTASTLNDYVDDLLSENEDPREALEEALDDMVRLVDIIVSRLEREGLKVERLTREAVLDVYDALEARLEEES